MRGLLLNAKFELEEQAVRVVMKTTDVLGAEARGGWQ